MRPLLSLCAFSFCLSVGYLLAMRSWGGVAFVYLGEERSPASVRRSDDYVQVPQNLLHQTAHSQLLSGSTIEKRAGQIAIHLGNPLVRNADGETDFACRVQGRAGLFDRVELFFTGTGVSESGENPVMTVSSACDGSTIGAEIAPIWIPMQEITKDPAADRIMNFDGTEVRLISMPGQWPDSWVLSRIRMFKQDDPLKTWTVDAAEMRRARPDLLSF